MRTPLSILSRGRLAGGIKKPLAMLAIGWLVTTGTPPIPPDNPSNGGGGNGSGGVSATISTWGKTNESDKDWQERIKLDDDLVFHIIKIWVEKCQT